MKLKLHSFDFEKCQLTFDVPKEIMQNNGFGNVPGGVEVDLFAITKNSALKSAGSPATDVQQLKAEIALCSDKLYIAIRDRSYINMSDVLSQLRQLSAV